MISKSITSLLQKQKVLFQFSSATYTQSFIEVSKDHPFPIQNIPFGVFQKDTQERRIGVPIGDQVLDIKKLAQEGLFSNFSESVQQALQNETLNSFLALKKADRAAVREYIQSLLSVNSAQEQKIRQSLTAVNDVEVVLPMQVGDYTDFYASRQHAENLGELFRPGGDKLFPNWLHMPIAYHGRASSINVDKYVKRSNGQTDLGVFGPEKRLDIELEMAVVIGGEENVLGHSVPIQEAQERIAGFTLMNDFSSRMIQKVEYQPLGPFLGKSFSTTLSPWVVLSEALEEFVQDVEPQADILPYLNHSGLHEYNIPLEVYLKPFGSQKTHLISESNMSNLHWTFEQMVAHHSVGGCNLRAGDIFGSGTISGDDASKNGGSMLELSWSGKKPMNLDGIERSFLQDGDTVIIRGGRRLKSGQFIGFGEISSTILPADQI